MTVQERLEKAMKKLGKNTNTLSKELDVTNSAISRVLRGQTLPSSKILIPLGAKLGVSVDWVLFGIGGMFLDPSDVDNIKPLKEGEKGKKQENKSSKEIEYLKQKLKEKDLLIAEKTKLLDAKDKIISLLEKK